MTSMRLIVIKFLMHLEFLYTVIAVTNDGITMINIYGMDTSAHKFLRSTNYMIFLLCSGLAEYYLKYIIISHMR